jgi:hypothetical protein
MCQPPKANSPATSARRNARGSIAASDVGICSDPNPSSTASRTPIAAILVIVNPVCTALPGRTPA